MESILSPALLAKLTLVSSALSLLCLLILHFVSREYKPSWRMISEYALGKHKWLITSFFIFWGLSSFFVALLLFNLVTSTAAITGVVLITISGTGAIMGGLFDVKHKLHGMAFALGIPTMPIGALLVAYHLLQNENWNTHSTALLVSSHALWISVVLMALSMMILFSGFKKAGIAMGPNVEPPKEVPSGVIAVNGYANRLLVLCYVHWSVMIAMTYLSFGG
jgi:hypothetical protein